jgi:hypothetical protein
VTLTGGKAGAGGDGWRRIGDFFICEDDNTAILENIGNTMRKLSS